MADAGTLAWQTVSEPRAAVRAADTLPDLLQPDLDVVFVGTAAGLHSAHIGHYYPGPGNRFWATLRDVGITPREYAPREFAKLLDLGIGLTDLSKLGCGTDHQIKEANFNVATFDEKLREYRPRAIAFTSKTTASLWLKRRTNRITYGRQLPRNNFPEVFVLCSPSAAARRYWRLNSWHELADWLRATQPWRF